MVCALFRGTASSSLSLISTNSPLPTSKPRTVSFHSISRFSLGHQRLFFMGSWQLGQSRRKLTLLDSVARYIRMGMATIPKLIAPRPIDLGTQISICGCSAIAQNCLVLINNHHNLPIGPNDPGNGCGDG